MGAERYCQRQHPIWFAFQRRTLSERYKPPQNIAFGVAMPNDFLVIHQCALKRDLDLFEAGDLTEVGEKGLTLSGGQKARVTLARAIYSSAEIVLLDDVLAALDIHTYVHFLLHPDFSKDIDIFSGPSGSSRSVSEVILFVRGRSFWL